MKTKIILILLNAVVLAAAVATILYFLVIIPWESSLLQKGYDAAVSQAVNIVKNSGSVRIGGILLVPAPQQTTPTVKK